MPRHEFAARKVALICACSMYRAAGTVHFGTQDLSAATESEPLGARNGQEAWVTDGQAAGSVDIVYLASAVCDRVRVKPRRVQAARAAGPAKLLP